MPDDAPRSCVGLVSDDNFVRSFLASHCADCHDSGADEGEFELKKLASEDVTSRVAYALIFERLRAGDMPPPSEPRPKADDVAQVVDWISAKLDSPLPKPPTYYAVKEKPIDGNRLPNAILFGGPRGPSVPPPPRLWRLSPDAYTSWATGAFNANGLQQPFGLIQEAGFRDFAERDKLKRGLRVKGNGILAALLHPDIHSAFINSVSASAARRPMPIVCQPDLAFQMLFGSVAEGNAGKVSQARNKLLDWCRNDIKRVRTELPAMDREQLDVYLDTFEQMRSRQDRINENRERLRANLPSTDLFDSQRSTQRLEAQCAIAAAALASRLTNVVTIDVNGGLGPTHHWKDLGVTLDDHAIGHMAGQPEREPHAVPIRRFHAERVADLARRRPGRATGRSHGIGARRHATSDFLTAEGGGHDCQSPWEGRGLSCKLVWARSAS